MPSEWNPESVQEVVRAFLGYAGLTEPEPRLIRFYQNAIVRLPSEHLALRIYGPENARERANLMVSFSRFLAEQDFPAVRLSTLFADQPIEILGMFVSVWNWIDQDEEGAKQPRAFGSLLRAMHAITDCADFRAGRFDPIAKIESRLERIEREQRLPVGHLDVLEMALERAAGLVADIEKSSIGDGLLHGDALIGNTILSGGRLVLIDFDSVGYGAREWDLAPTFVTATRFRQRVEVWQDFLAGYGTEGASLPGIEAAGIVKQLSMTVALCLSRGLSPAVDIEIDRRIRCWADWDFETPWYSPALLPTG